MLAFRPEVAGCFVLFSEIRLVVLCSIPMSNSQIMNSPVRVFDDEFAKNPKNACTTFSKLVKEMLDIEDTNLTVPLVEDHTVCHIPDGHLVCLRGMVQDMFDTEMYVSSYNSTSLDSTDLKTTQYRDVDYFKADQAIDEQSIQFANRQSFIVRSVPGESAWVKAYALPQHVNSYEVTGCKRSHSRQDMEPVAAKKFATDIEGDKMDTSTDEQKVDPVIPDMHGAILRVYDDKLADSLKLTDIIVAYGILEHARLGASDNNADAEKKIENCLLPRVHAILVDTCNYNGPTFRKVSEVPAADALVLGSQRAQVISLFEGIFRGDTLAAEYTLMHLLSTRCVMNSPYPTTMPGLNICNWKDGSADLSSMPLATLLQNLVPQLTEIEVNVERLNSGPLYMPVRNASTGQLTSGHIQLPVGGQILVDETKMDSGQLNSKGLINLQTLTLLATQRKLTYDFQFYTQDWDSDVRVLVISEYPSLVKPLLTVYWMPEPESQSTTSPPEFNFKPLRQYLLMAMTHGDEYLIEPSVQNVINHDFVEWRRDKSTYIEADELAVMLCLLRLYTISHGLSSPTEEHWKSIISMEASRRSRIKISGN